MVRNENKHVADADWRSGKSSTAFRTISEVSKELGVPQHVLRFWETKFNHINPLKRRGGRRYYRPEDVLLLRRIRDLRYNEGYTIRGVQRLFREGGVKRILKETPVINTNEEVKQVENEREVKGNQATPEIDKNGLTDEIRNELKTVLDELAAMRLLLTSN